ISGITRSTPKSSDSGNIMPASMTMMSSPSRSAIMFMPNSPRPPRGMAARECDGSAVWAAEEVGDGNENNGTERRGRERVKKTAAPNPELRKNPAAEEGSDQAENDVRDAAEAAATRDLSRKPAGDQAKEKPRDNTV